MKTFGTSALVLIAAITFGFVDMTAQQIAVKEIADTAQVIRRSPALDAIVSPDVKIERVAKGFVFTEGPMWHQGALWFSDLRGNKMSACRPTASCA
jgi:gluconolactonase